MSLKHTIAWLVLVAVLAMAWTAAQAEPETKPAPSKTQSKPPRSKSAAKPSKAKGAAMTDKATADDKVTKSEAEWRKQLTPEQFTICRKAGTEQAFTGKLWDEHREGKYFCVACGQQLFESATKFNSGTGWPSFWQPAKQGAVEEKVDKSHGSVRTEIRCSKCGSHLGHVFDDGPKPTGLRYCMNSAALKFEPKEDQAK